MITSEFNQLTGFLDSRFKGKVKLQEIVDFMEATKNNRIFPRSLKILTDTTNAEFDMTTFDLNKIVEANNQSLEQYDYIIDAIVIENPKVMALSILYQELAENKKYIFKIFSTREAAIDWLISIIHEKSMK